MNENTDAIPKDEVQNQWALDTSMAERASENISSRSKSCKQNLKPSSDSEVFQTGDNISNTSRTVKISSIISEETEEIGCEDTLSEDYPSSLTFSKAENGIWSSTSDSYLAENKTPVLEVRASCSYDATDVSAIHRSRGQWTKKYEDQSFKEGDNHNEDKKPNKEYFSPSKKINLRASPNASDTCSVISRNKKMLRDESARIKTFMTKRPSHSPKKSILSGNEFPQEELHFSVVGDSLIQEDGLNSSKIAEEEETQHPCCKEGLGKKKIQRKKWILPTEGVQKYSTYIKEKKPSTKSFWFENNKGKQTFDFHNQKLNSDFDTEDLNPVIRKNSPLQEENKYFPSQDDSESVMDSCSKICEPVKGIGREVLKSMSPINKKVTDNGKSKPSYVAISNKKLSTEVNQKSRCELTDITEIIKKLKQEIGNHQIQEIMSGGTFEDSLVSQENLRNEISSNDTSFTMEDHCSEMGHQPFSDEENYTNDFPKLDDYIRQLTETFDKIRENLAAANAAINSIKQDKIQIASSEQYPDHSHLKVNENHFGSPASDSFDTEVPTEGDKEHGLKKDLSHYNADCDNILPHTKLVNEVDSLCNDLNSLLTRDDEHRRNLRNDVSKPRIDGKGDTPVSITQLIHEIITKICQRKRTDVTQDDIHEQPLQRDMNQTPNPQVLDQSMAMKSCEFGRVYHRFVLPAIMEDIEEFTETAGGKLLHDCELSNDETNSSIRMQVEQRLQSPNYRYLILSKITDELHKHISRKEPLQSQLPRDENDDGVQQHRNVSPEFTFAEMPSAVELIECIKMACLEVFKMWQGIMERDIFYDTNEDCLTGMLSADGAHSEDSDLDLDNVLLHEYLKHSTDGKYMTGSDEEDNKEVDDSTWPLEVETSTGMPETNLSDTQSSCCKEESKEIQNNENDFEEE